MSFNLAGNKLGMSLVGLGTIMRKQMYQMTKPSSKMKFASPIYGSSRTFMLSKPGTDARYQVPRAKISFMLPEEKRSFLKPAIRFSRFHKLFLGGASCRCDVFGHRCFAVYNISTLHHYDVVPVATLKSGIVEHRKMQYAAGVAMESYYVAMPQSYLFSAFIV
jgi:hypothetical protein